MKGRVNLDLLLDSCLQELAAGASVEDCLAHHQPWCDKLEPALRAAARLMTEATATPEADFSHRLRASLVQHARASRPVTKRRLLRPFGRERIPDWSQERRRYPMSSVIAAIALLATLFGGGGGLAYAAQDALPGQPLYTVKGLVEAARLATAADNTERTMLYLQFADEKLAEADQLLAEGQEAMVAASLQAYNRHMLAVAASVEQPASSDEATRLQQMTQARLQNQVRALEQVQARLQQLAQNGADTGNAQQAVSAALDNASQLQKWLQERDRDRDREQGRDQSQDRDQDQERDQDREQLPAVTATAVQAREREQERAREMTATPDEQPTAGSTPQQNREQNGAGRPQLTATPVPAGEQNREQNGPGQATVTPQPAGQEQNQEQNGVAQPTDTPQPAEQQNQHQEQNQVQNGAEQPTATPQQSQNQEQNQGQNGMGQPAPTDAQPTPSGSQGADQGGQPQGGAGAPTDGGGQRGGSGR
ncbi:MAG: DUF5667 domain-containing protein [Anaerolineae bacterium]